MNTYQICTRCIRDTSDPGINFDDAGLCHYCQIHDKKMAAGIAQKSGDPQKLKQVIVRIKSLGAGRKYDCLIGLSGGADSSYLASLAVENGLRPLTVHVDSGWDDQLAVANIKKIVSKLSLPFINTGCDWDEFKDLQLAFIRAGVINCDHPQDHAIIAASQKIAADHGIRVILSGTNYATESGEHYLSRTWWPVATDLAHLKSVHARFGKKPLKTYPQMSFFKYNFYYPYFKKIRSVRLLNYVDYKKDDAKQFLKDYFGWQDYGEKHYESVFTRFLQAYYLPQKFGFDKRRTHYSSLILSGQMTRAQALEKMKEIIYSDAAAESDKSYIAQKLGVTREEFENILKQPTRSAGEFANSEKILQFKLRLFGGVPEIRI